MTSVSDSHCDELPHIEGLLVEFLTGALATYIRFTAEFAPGSLIDLASEQEKKDAWMPATNDHNEGALGSYWVMMRFKPSLTIQQYNAMVLWSRNNTQAFMDAKFTEDDFRYIMKEAHILDASKTEARRCKEQVEFNKRVAALKREKAEARILKDREQRERLSRVVLLKEPSEVTEQLTVHMLDDQLDVLRLMESLKVPKKTKCGRKAERAEILREVLGKYNGMGRPTFEMFFKDSEDVNDIIVDSWEEEEDDMDVE